MKLFLSSMHPSNREAFLNLFEDRDSLSAVIVPTGWDAYPAKRRETELSHVLSTLENFGFTTSLLDLVNATKDSIQVALTEKSLVWVMAGNTFYLNFHLHKSGFADVIKSHIEAGLVYGGESAGAVVAGTTLHGVENVDDPKESPEIIWDGLGLLDHGILPHADWEKYQEQISAAGKEMAKFTKTISIGNNQAVVVVGSKEDLVENPSDKE
jgi:dipeptidase E